MGLLGTGAVGAMQKSIRDNKALRKKKKSLVDITKNYHEKPGGVINDKKMSPSEFDLFKSNLLIKKSKEKKQRLLLLIALISLGILVLLLIKFNFI
ncbi:MAG: hypothetical protein H6587_08035 [Flavobacteriales bacterium]|nr:hypothetical protein [Flavobacteriales bacterium]MCB9364502.1 hypothetical protein [Flavobacteriales bacterium]